MVIHSGIGRTAIELFIVRGVVGVFDVHADGFASIFGADFVGGIRRTVYGFAVYQPLVMRLGGVNAIFVVNGRG